MQRLLSPSSELNWEIVSPEQLVATRRSLFVNRRDDRRTLYLMTDDVPENTCFAQAELQRGRLALPTAH
jgi:hypothetical protein